MNRQIIKRNGSIEAFNPHKLIKWAEWASNENVDWFGIISQATQGLPEKISSRDLQKRLIDACNSRNTWSYSIMANKLYATMVHKDLYPNGLPSVSDLQKHLFEIGLMKDMSYSDYEMNKINEYIDHNKDLEMPLFSFEYLMHKYGLQNRYSKTQYETPQFIYMRCAMEACAGIKDTLVKLRVEHVLDAYTLLSDKKISLPTPDYTTLGSNSSISPSCCLIHSLDTKESIGIYHHIAYTMTCVGAGIGGNMDVRSINDPVRNGAILHQGQLPYLASLGRFIKSSKQQSRGGAGTQYVSCFNPEIMDLIRLQHPYTPKEKSNRDLHIAIMYNHFFMEKVAKNGDVVLFNAFTAPKLNEAFYSNDNELFRKLYNEYVDSLGDKAKFVNAREIIKLAGECWNEVSTVYPSFITNINTHTPFKDKIRSSNLCCVTGDQLVVTSKGLRYVKDLYENGENLELFDGNEKVLSSPMRKLKFSETIKIKLSNGLSHEVTPDHRVSTQNGIKFASDLRVGDKVEFQVKKGLFGSKDMLDEAFLLGLYQADGTQTKKEIMIDIWENNYDLIPIIQEKFNNIHYKYGCDKFNSTNQHGHTWVKENIKPAKFHDTTRVGNINKKRLASRTLKKSLNFEKGYIPKWILESNENTQIEYIKGLFFGDGSTSYNKESGAFQLSIANINFKFLQELQILLLNLGMPFSLGQMYPERISMLPNSKREYAPYKTKACYRLTTANKNVGMLFESKTGFLTRKGVNIDYSTTPLKNFSKIVSLSEGDKQDVYCVEVYNDKHLWVCNGIVTHNCEIMQPTHGYSNISELLSTVELKDWHKGEQEPEISLCFLGGINVAEYISDEEYYNRCLFLLRKIDYTIDNCEYPFPHLGITAKARRNAGVGVGGLASWLAKNKLKYNSVEGRAEIHKIFERHSYFMIKASLELSKEKGTATWIYKTKWPDGWLPIDTYNKNVDSITPPVYYYDWESLRKEIIANGGIRNSCLVAHMPMESSSKATGVPNGVYPIRDVALFKTDGGNGIDWLAYKHDDSTYEYQLAWDLSNEDIVKFYAIIQKFGDSGLSADFWVDRTENFEISETEHNIKLFLLMNKYGLKGGYYKNSKTSSLGVKEKDMCEGGSCDS